MFDDLFVRSPLKIDVRTPKKRADYPLQKVQQNLPVFDHVLVAGCVAAFFLFRYISN
jgi:hypothetical protein